MGRFKRPFKRNQNHRNNLLKGVDYIAKILWLIALFSHVAPFTYKNLLSKFKCDLS